MDRSLRRRQPTAVPGTLEATSSSADLAALEREDLWVRRIGIPLTGFAMPAAGGILGPLPVDDWRYWAAILYATGITFLVWHALRRWGLVRHGSRHWFEHPYRSWSNYLLVSILSGFVASYLAAAIWYLLIGMAVDWTVAGRVGWLAVILTCVLMQLYISLFARVDLTFAASLSEQLREEDARTRQAARAYRPEPSGILEALGALRDLILASPAKAVRHAETIALVYRYVLRESSHDLVLLREELALIERHAELLAERLRSDLRVILSVPEEALDRYLVVPTALHSVLGACVRSGPATGADAVSIVFRLVADRLVVSVDPCPAAGGRATLEGIDARVRETTGEGLEITRQEHTTTCSVPLLAVSG